MNHVNVVKKTNKPLAAVTPTHVNALSNVLVVIVAPILIVAKVKSATNKYEKPPAGGFFIYRDTNVSKPGHHGEFYNSRYDPLPQHNFQSR